MKIGIGHKIKRRIIAAAAAFAVAAGGIGVGTWLPTETSAQEAAETDFEYTILEDGTVTASYDAGKQQSVTVSWSSSDTSVATVDSSGKVTFNKDKGSNASSTITASYSYMGKIYSAARTVSISYGSWSS